MRVLVISDIHANLAAFETVLEDSRDQWEQIWCLGDIVGYGPEPDACVTLLRQHDHLSLSGNHDWAVLGKLDIDAFNRDARAAIEWARNAISDETRTYLESLPVEAVQGLFTLAHGSPRQPVWEYILDESIAAANFAHFDSRFCLVGHTHMPVIFEEEDDGARASRPAYGEKLALAATRLIINPGSVGQPRDADPRAAYALLDTEAMTWEHRRVAYPIGVTQARMQELGLPHRLVARLEMGW
jgi:predicted phosphodiesterase